MDAMTFAKTLALQNPSTKTKIKATKWFIDLVEKKDDFKVFRNLRKLRLGAGFPAPIEFVFEWVKTEVEAAPVRKLDDIFGYDPEDDQDPEELDLPQPTTFQWMNLKRFGVPIRRVSLDAVNLINACPSPSSMPLWEEKTTPKFPTTHYVFPNNAFRIDGKSVIGMTVSIMRAEEMHEEMDKQNQHIGYVCPKIKKLQEPDEHNKFIVTAFYANKPSLSVVTLIQDNCLDMERDVQDGLGAELPTEDLDFSKKVLSAAVQLLLLENTKPEFDIEEKEEVERSGSGKSQTWYVPKLIGGKMGTILRRATHTSNPSGDKKRPKEHWKGAHWKQVAYGPKMGLRKPKLILPYLVNLSIE